jgi:aromatic-L-amino-acid decarboxylase
VIDYRDWGVPLGRRFRALKLWFVIRSYGVGGLQEILRRHIDLAAQAEAWLLAAADFELLAARNLSLFNFRYHPIGCDDEAELDALNQRLVEAVNDRGVTYITQNNVAGRYAIRFNVGQSETREEHVRQAWDEITAVARGLGQLG